MKNLKSASGGGFESFCEHFVYTCYLKLKNKNFLLLLIAFRQKMLVHYIKKERATNIKTFAKQKNNELDDVEKVMPLRIIARELDID